MNFETPTSRSRCKIIERKFCVCHEWRKLKLSLSLSLWRIHILVQINLPIHCFPLQFPHKGRQICCKMKENYQKHLCGNQSTHLNLFNSIFRDPCHVNTRTTSVSLKMQLYHVKHYLKSVNNYIFPNFHLCIQNL